MNFYQIIFLVSLLGLLNIPLFVVLYDKLANADMIVAAVVVVLVDVLVFSIALFSSLVYVYLYLGGLK